MRQPLGLILSGGLTKADWVLGGSRLIDLCIERLEPQVGEIAVNANDPITCDLPVVADTEEGPLAGVLAGLTWAKAKGETHVVTVAVDTPFFPCDLVPQLWLAGDGGLTIAATSEGRHDTFGLWPVSLIDHLSEFLRDSGGEIQGFTDAQNAACATFPDTTPAPFFNINTLADLKAAQSWV